MSKERIVVTGAAGFIGSNLCRALLREGYQVVGVDNLTAGLKENLPPEVEFHAIDIREPGLERVLKGATAIFHLAAKNTLLDCIKDPLATVDNNVKGTVMLLEAMRRASIDRLLYADTSAEYEGISVFPTPEANVSPLGVYAASKRAAWLFCNSYVSLHGLKLTTLRYFNVYGPAQDWRRSLPPVMSAFAIRLMRGEQPIIYGTGEKARDFIHVDDVNRFHLLALRDPRSIDRIFNLGSGVATSVNEVYALVEGILRTGLKPVYRPDNPGEAFKTQADIGAARSMGWAPELALNSGVRQFLDYIRPKVESQAVR